MKVAISQRIERKVSMMSVEQVSLFWYKKQFYKTILDRYREFRLAKESNLNYMRSAPIIRMPGEIYFTLIKLSTPETRTTTKGESSIANRVDKPTPGRSTGFNSVQLTLLERPRLHDPMC